MEPWDEPDEGEKLRASARPPEPAERKACSRFRPHTLVPAEQLLDLPEFTSKNEFLHQAQRRFTTEGGPQQELARPRPRAKAGGLRKVGSPMPREEEDGGQGAGQGQGAGEA